MHNSSTKVQYVFLHNKGCAFLCFQTYIYVKCQKGLFREYYHILLPYQLGNRSGSCCPLWERVANNSSFSLLCCVHKEIHGSWSFQKFHTASIRMDPSWSTKYLADCFVLNLYMKKDPIGSYKAGVGCSSSSSSCYSPASMKTSTLAQLDKQLLCLQPCKRSGRAWGVVQVHDKAVED